MATEVEDDIDLSAGFRPHGSVHPAGKVTAFDEATGLPIVRRNAVTEESHEHHDSGQHHADSTPNHPKGEKEDAGKVGGSEEMALHAERKEGSGSGGRKGVAGQQQGAETAGAGGEEDIQKEVGQTKYKYGNTQADIPADSEAGKALAAVRAKIDKADLMPSSNTAGGGGLEDDSHITVRYGIDGDDMSGIRAFLEKQEPFEATLGKVTSFPPSEHSDGAAPIVVAIESPELRALEKEMDKHGQFIDRTFPEYKPHATLGYVKPEAAKKYVGMGGTEGKKFIVSSVSISKKDGSKEDVKFKGGAAPTKDAATGRDVLHQSTDRAELVKQAKDHAKQFEDGLKSATRGIAGAKFDAVRPEKTPERMDEKINDEGQPVHTIPDILAGRIGVDTPEAHERTAAAIKSHFKVIRDEDEFDKGSPPTNYRVHKMQVQVTPQLSAEAHIVPKEVLEANAHQHDVYDAAREADLDGKEATAEKKEKQAKAINDAAMEKFNARNSGHSKEADAVSADAARKGGRGKSPEPNAADSGSGSAAPKLTKGMTVIHGDSHGIVRGGNPNFSNGGGWRIETPDGTKTVKGSEVTPVESAKPEDRPYIAFDLDRTLAEQRGAFKGPTVIGKPIPEMIDRIKDVLKNGEDVDGKPIKDVRIFTARVTNDPRGMARAAIEAWLHRNIGQSLPITDRKDHWMARLYDDRARQVEPNTGKVIG
jgi:hypothetical protein